MINTSKKRKLSDKKDFTFSFGTKLMQKADQFAEQDGRTLTGYLENLLKKDQLYMDSNIDLQKDLQKDIKKNHSFRFNKILIGKAIIRAFQEHRNLTNYIESLVIKNQKD